jgi:hypothetical protein
MEMLIMRIKGNPAGLLVPSLEMIITRERQIMMYFVSQLKIKAV